MLRQYATQRYKRCCVRYWGWWYCDAGSWKSLFFTGLSLSKWWCSFDIVSNFLWYLILWHSENVLYLFITQLASKIHFLLINPATSEVYSDLIVAFCTFSHFWSWCFPVVTIVKSREFIFESCQKVHLDFISLDKILSQLPTVCSACSAVQCCSWKKAFLLGSLYLKLYPVASLK